jgi:hypothetical protein
MLLRRNICLLFIPLFILTTFLLHRSNKLPDLSSLKPGPSEPLEKPRPLRKPVPEPPPPIVDNFPLADKAVSPSDLPPIPSWNKPPSPHVRESTPLFIGFTRNWRLLQQTVVSYITAGWPPEDIYVIENTGVMNSNRDGLLTLQNPFYLDHKRLTKALGISVISTPTLFTFAQLQNFYIYTALDRNWTHYFWAHMDTVVVSDEEWKPEGTGEWKSLYVRAVDAMRQTMEPAWGALASLWFAYDRLALVRTQAFVDVGGWDTAIPFYMTDCDMHERLWMKEFRIENAEAGKVWDVASTLDDLTALYTRGEPPKMIKREDAAVPPPAPAAGSAARNSPAYKALLQKLDEMQHAKATAEGGRNTWQARQRGGQGEPFYRDPDGFEKGVLMWMDFGRDVFYEKWGRGPCDIRDAGMVEGDAWRVVKDWELPKVQKQYKKDKDSEEREKKKVEKEEEEATKKDEEKTKPAT